MTLPAPLSTEFDRFIAPPQQAVGRVEHEFGKLDGIVWRFHGLLIQPSWRPGRGEA
jgi:hypothetical protein